MQQSGRRLVRREESTEAARQLWQRQTDAEAILWEELRARRLAGLKFRRQVPLGPYIVGFCCQELRLVIELDGAVRQAQRDYDAARTDELEARGYVVLRFANDQISNNLHATLVHIQALANSIATSPLPRERERGRLRSG